MAKTNRKITRQTRQTASTRQVNRPTTLGTSNKAIRDGADPNARDGKKPKEAAGAYLGELVIVAKLTPAQKEEIMNIVRSGKKTPGDDSRIISVAEKGGKIVIHTSSDDLAVSIGKKIHNSHKGGSLTVVWGKAELPARVTWTAKK